MPEQSTATAADQTVSANLRALLARRRITARSVALAIEMPERQFRRRLRAEVPWLLSELLRVADHLDVPVGELTVRS